jgi:uncharacterized membrane protein YeaQ/YmgE (transglycosylase-associated protein family)
MLEFLLWLLAGMVVGWVGYLATRPSIESSVRRYLIAGSLSALVGGFLARGVGFSPGTPLGVNPNSLVTALVVSSLCVMLVRFLHPESGRDL